MILLCYSLLVRIKQAVLGEGGGRGWGDFAGMEEMNFNHDKNLRVLRPHLF